MDLSKISSRGWGLPGWGDEAAQEDYKKPKVPVNGIRSSQQYAQHTDLIIPAPTLLQPFHRRYRCQCPQIGKSIYGYEGASPIEIASHYQAQSKPMVNLYAKKARLPLIRVKVPNCHNDTLN